MVQQLVNLRRSPYFTMKCHICGTLTFWEDNKANSIFLNANEKIYTTNLTVIKNTCYVFIYILKQLLFTLLLQVQN